MTNVHFTKFCKLGPWYTCAVPRTQSQIGDRSFTAAAEQFAGRNLTMKHQI